MNMYVMLMNEHAWTCMRMYENDSCSREGWVILDWVALYDIHDNEWECTRMTENDWERLTSKENGWGGGHSMRICTLYDMHETEWESLRLSHNWWTCVWWYGVVMHENVWYWLIFKGCVSRLRLSRMPRHAWWMYQNDSYPCDVRAAQHWFTCDGSHNVTHAPITPIHSYDDTPILL